MTIDLNEEKGEAAHPAVSMVLILTQMVTVPAERHLSHGCPASLPVIGIGYEASLATRLPFTGIPAAFSRVMGSSWSAPSSRVGSGSLAQAHCWGLILSASDWCGAYEIKQSNQMDAGGLGGQYKRLALSCWPQTREDSSATASLTPQSR